MRRVARRLHEQAEQPAEEPRPAFPLPPAAAQPWTVHGHQLMQGQVLSGLAPPFLVCTTCYLYAREPKMVWRGLCKPCDGADASRTRTGSRAQARNDLKKQILPAAPKGKKEPFGSLHGPTAATRALWAPKLGVEAQETATAGAGAGSAASGAAAARSPAGASAQLPQPAAGGQELILPPLASVARAHGFADLAEARARGREAREARAESARARA